MATLVQEANEASISEAKHLALRSWKRGSLQDSNSYSLSIFFTSAIEKSVVAKGFELVWGNRSHLYKYSVSARLRRADTEYLQRIRPQQTNHYGISIQHLNLKVQALKQLSTVTGRPQFRLENRKCRS